jgi:SulP family sulfate permease
VKPRSTLLNDAWGGFAAMLVALPSAIAYGVAAYGGLGAEFVSYGVRASIIGAVVLGLVAGAIGGAPRLISAPSAPASAVMASVAAAMLASGRHVDRPTTLVLLGGITLLSGVLQTLYGALGGGRLIKFIPYPVVAGYLSAVAVMIAVGQIPKVLGATAGVPLAVAVTSPNEWRLAAILITGVTVVTMIVTPRLTTKVPAAIAALVLGIATHFALALADARLRVPGNNPLLLGNIGAVKLGNVAAADGLLQALRRLTGEDLASIILPALTLSVLLSVDSLKTCVIVDALTFTRHDSNRTLLGQGAGNTVAALLGGMPGSGVIGATVVNMESGGQSRAAGWFESSFVVLAVLVLGRWLEWVPLAALAGILLVVAARMFDWRSFRLLRQRATMLEFAVVGIVVVVAVATNLVAAAGAGVGLAMLLFIRDQIRGSVIRRKISGARISSKQHRRPDEQAVLEQYGAETVVCELQGSLFFGTTDQLYRELEPDLKTCRFLILDLRRVLSLDYTAAHLFGQFAAMLQPRDGWILFSRVPARAEWRESLLAAAHGDPAIHQRVFETLDDALQWSEDQIIAGRRPPRPPTDAPLALGAFDLTRGLEDDATLAALAACAAARSVDAGATIFSAGGKSDELYLVRRGVIRVTMPLNGKGYHTLATFGPGNFFGEMAFLVGGTRSADATATTAAELFVISREEFDRVSRACPVLGEKIFARLAHALALRLRRADAELRAFYEA